MSSEPIHPSPEELFAYRDGELPAERRTLIEVHVASCHACRERIDRVSQLEAGLRQRPDAVGDEYYARLSESVLGKIGAGAVERTGARERAGAAARAEEARAAAAAGPPAEGLPAAEALPATEAAPRRERRRPDSPVEERRPRAPGFPWPALVSTVAAAGAVVVVVVLLFQQGPLRRPWDRVAALRAPAESAATAPGAPPTGAPESAGGSASAPVPAPAPAPGPLPVAEKKAATAPPAPAAGLEQKPAVASNLADRLAARAKEEKAAAPIVPAAPQTPPEVARSESKGLVRAATESGGPAKAPAPAAAPPAPPAAGETPYRALLRRHDLPSLWEEGRVSARSLLGAEPDLRALYMTGRAGADSARVRLYLAEAARLAYAAHPDSVLYTRIVHHYLRAIRIAGPESDVGRVARERLQSFSR